MPLHISLNVGLYDASNFVLHPGRPPPGSALVTRGKARLLFFPPFNVTFCPASSVCTETVKTRIIFKQFQNIFPDIFRFALTQSFCEEK